MERIQDKNEPFTDIILVATLQHKGAPIEKTRPVGGTYKPSDFWYAKNIEDVLAH